MGRGSDSGVRLCDRSISVEYSAAPEASSDWSVPLMRRANQSPLMRLPAGTAAAAASPI